MRPEIFSSRGHLLPTPTPAPTEVRIQITVILVAVETATVLLLEVALTPVIMMARDREVEEGLLR